MSEVDEYIVQLNKKLEDNIVKKKEKNFKKNEGGRLCAQVTD